MTLVDAGRNIHPADHTTYVRVSKVVLAILQRACYLTSYVATPYSTVETLADVVAHISA